MQIQNKIAFFLDIPDNTSELTLKNVKIFKLKNIDSLKSLILIDSIILNASNIKVINYSSHNSKLFSKLSLGS